MADRLPFKFIRMAKVVSIGEVTVDVNNPFDEKEIEQRLRNKEFASLLFTDHEYDDDQWQFIPIEEEYDEAENDNEH